MESLRRRFMTPRALGATVAIPELDNKPNSKSHEIPRNDPIIVMELSTSKRIILSNGIVTIYDSLGATDLSTTSSPESKILALESLHDLLRLQDRQNLDPNNERPVVKKIIETFASKNDCLQAIDRCVCAAEHRRVLTNWVTEVWVEDIKSTPLNDSSDKESHGGSEFSDSDVVEIKDNRVRPITLRPRKSSQPIPTSTIVVKTEAEKTFKNASEIKPTQENNSARRIRRSSLPREGAPASRTQIRSTLRQHTQSSSSLRHNSSSNELATDGIQQAAKKHALPMCENIVPDDNCVKRVKLVDVIPRRKSISEKSESMVLARALRASSSSNDAFGFSTNLTSAEAVSKCWREITSKLPPEVKILPTIDRLAYYFREAEFAKKENEILKLDETERRKSMMLMAEKIKLMNQPVARSSASGNNSKRSKQ